MEKPLKMCPPCAPDGTVFCWGTKIDGFVKRPSAALRFIFRRCSVLLCTPHSSRFARLASGAFYCAVHLDDFLRVHQN
jgi:hypothetical protein